MSRARLPSLLRRADQSLVAVLVLLALVSMVAFWVRSGGLRGGLIDIDQGQPRSARFCVDINAAGWPELAQLPGVGETLARRIVQSRVREGPYRRHADLERIHGLGPKLLQRIRPYLSPLPVDDRPRPRGREP